MNRAHMNYVAAVNKGSDGRPNFHARKACNYAEEAIQVIFLDHHFHFFPPLSSFLVKTLD